MELWEDLTMGESVTRRLLRVKDAIDRDLTREWSTAALAVIALLSPTHFRRSFRKTFGESPRAYLYRRRIGQAKMLLRTTDTPVTEISLMVGYSSLGTFTRTFVRLTGQTPTQHRAQGPLPAIPSCMLREVERPRGDVAAPQLGGEPEDGRSGEAPSSGASLA